VPFRPLDFCGDRRRDAHLWDFCGARKGPDCAKDEIWAGPGPHNQPHNLWSLPHARVTERYRAPVRLKGPSGAYRFKRASRIFSAKGASGHPYQPVRLAPKKLPGSSLAER
jgi:hypothetical protein